MPNHGSSVDVLARRLVGDFEAPALSQPICRDERARADSIYAVMTAGNSLLLGGSVLFVIRQFQFNKASFLRTTATFCSTRVSCLREFPVCSHGLYKPHEYSRLMRKLLVLASIVLCCAASGQSQYRGKTLIAHNNSTLMLCSPTILISFHGETDPGRKVYRA